MTTALAPVVLPQYASVWLWRNGEVDPLPGPVLVATFDWRWFQVLAPGRDLFIPMIYEVVRRYGALPSQEVALALFYAERERAVGE